MNFKALCEKLEDIPFEVKNIDNELEIIKFDTLLTYIKEFGFEVKGESEFGVTVTHEMIMVENKPWCFSLAKENAMDYADSVMYMIRRISEHSGKNQLSIVMELLELQG